MTDILADYNYGNMSLASLYANQPLLTDATYRKWMETLGSFLLSGTPNQKAEAARRVDYIEQHLIWETVMNEAKEKPELLEVAELTSRLRVAQRRYAADITPQNQKACEALEKELDTKLPKVLAKANGKAAA